MGSVPSCVYLVDMETEVTKCKELAQRLRGTSIANMNNRQKDSKEFYFNLLCYDDLRMQIIDRSYAKAGDMHEHQAAVSIWRGIRKKTLARSDTEWRVHECEMPSSVLDKKHHQYTVVVHFRTRNVYLY